MADALDKAFKTVQPDLSGPTVLLIQHVAKKLRRQTVDNPLPTNIPRWNEWLNNNTNKSLLSHKARSSIQGAMLGQSVGKIVSTPQPSNIEVPPPKPDSLSDKVLQLSSNS